MSASASCGPDTRAERSALASLLAAELEQPVDRSALRMAEAIRSRHPDAVEAVVFYGSCLRRGTPEGVLDFYAFVDSYRDVYTSRRLRLLATALPPNVHYLELPADDPASPRLRAKYGIMRLSDFQHAAAGRGVDTRIWARFCQPARLVWARDAAAHDAVLDAVVTATLTAADRMRAWLPGDDALQSIRPEEIFANGFRETYRAEFRSESATAIRALVDHDAARYSRVGAEALRELARRGRLRIHEAESRAGILRVESDVRARVRARQLWQVQRRVAKARTALAQLKTTATFDDWVSYALFKLERHSGARIEVSERQRRHPWIFGWPVLWRLLVRRTLH